MTKAKARWAPSRGRTLRTSLVTLIVVLVAVLVAGVYSAPVARYVPYLGSVLNLAAPRLPANVAWQHDRGTPRLRPGAYLGWSDGVTGELHLYGEGCSGGADPPTSTIVHLALSGPAGMLEFTPDAVQQLWSELDRANPHPHIQVRVVTDTELTFDRATLRCRDGSEAHARILGQVLYVPQEHRHAEGPQTPLAVDWLWNNVLIEDLEGPLAALHGPVSYPGPGLVSELTVTTVELPFTLRELHYGPRSLVTGTLLAAGGHLNALPYWREQALTDNGAPSGAPPLLPLTPWHHGYQAPTDPRALRPRPAAALDLDLAPGETGVMYMFRTAFRPTPEPKPVLLKQVLEYQHGEQSGSLVAAGLAFGFTPTP